MRLDLERLAEFEPHAFGQIAEQVVNGRGPYDDETRQAVVDELFHVGRAVGRTSIMRVVRDPEVGSPSIAVSNRPDMVRDPLVQGV